MLKKELMLIALLFCLLNLSAQGNNHIKLGIETGLLKRSDFKNVSLFLYVEPKLMISENIAIGLRIGAAVNPQTFENYDSFQFFIHDESGNGVISCVPTFEYYLNENKFRPFLGLGAGPYLLADYIEVTQSVSGIPSKKELDVYVDYQIGFLFRGGFESRKSRFGLEYNFIPKADIEIPDGQVIGTVNTSYFALSIGFVIGGG